MPESLSDRDLLEAVGFPVGTDLSQEVFGISRQALGRGINPSRPSDSRRTAHFLHLDRLLQLYEYLQRPSVRLKKTDDAITILLEQIHLRYPKLNDLLAPGALDWQKIDFSEMWLFCDRPRELDDDRFTRESITPLLNTENILAYFVPNLDVAENLQAKLALAIDNKPLENLYVIATPLATILSHVVVRFLPDHSLESPNRAAYIYTVAKVRPFAPVPDHMFDNLAGALIRGRLLRANYRLAEFNESNIKTFDKITSLTFEVVYHPGLQR